MKKSDLKDGMMVKDRKGTIYFVFNDCLETENLDYIDLMHYFDDMECINKEQYDIMEVVDARNFEHNLAQRFEQYGSFPVLWKREEYNFKPGDKVEVKNAEKKEWVRGYFLNKVRSLSYPYRVTGYDEFCLGMSFEDAASNGRCGSCYRYIRPYKEEK